LQVTQKYRLKFMLMAAMFPCPTVTIWQTGTAKRSLFYTWQLQTTMICYHR